MAAAKLIERFVFLYEFNPDVKFNHVKLLMEEKYSHTITTEKYGFYCFKKRKHWKAA